MVLSRMRIELYWRLWGNFRSNVGYFLYLSRRKEAAAIQRTLEEGRLPQPRSYFPTRLNLRLLYNCNLRCKMCGQWGESGSYYSYDDSKRAKVLPQEVIFNVLSELKAKGLKLVDMEGGETLLYPRLGELLSRLRSMDIYVKFATNGTLLHSHAEEIVRSRVRSVTVSLDGHRPAHNAIRGRHWAYDKTICGLRALSDMKKRLGQYTPLVQIAFTMSRHNGAAALRSLCEDLRGKALADVLEVKLTPIFVPQYASQKYLRIGESILWIDRRDDLAERIQRGLLGFCGREQKDVKFASEISKAPLDFFVELLPHIPLEEVPRLYSEYAWDLGRSPCTVPFTEPTIDADGNVYPCNLFTDAALSMGNVHETPFLHIWEGERFTTFRKMLMDQGGLLPICNRCCQLTEY